MSQSIYTFRPNESATELQVRRITKTIPSIQEFLKAPSGYIQSICRQVGTAEMYNISYSWFHGADRNDKTGYADIIPLDIDGFIKEDLESVIKIVADVTNTNPQKCGIVWSGHGIHYLIPATPFSSDDLPRLKPYYAELRAQISKSLAEHAIAGKIDDIWDSARLLRLPETWNRKPQLRPQESSQQACYILSSSMEPHGFNIEAFIPGSLTKAAASRFNAFKPNADLIMGECQFLKAQLECNGAGKGYGEWFAAIGITAWLEDNDRYTHEISKGHSDYSHDATTRKADECRKSAGPRSCSSIAESVLGACVGCKYLGTIKNPTCIRDKTNRTTPLPAKEDNKVKKSAGRPKGSPNKQEKVQNIVSNDDFAGENTPNNPNNDELTLEQWKELGFTEVIETKKGVKTTRRPDKLGEWFLKETNFVNVPAAKRKYCYESGIYRKITEDEIKAIAQKYYFPVCLSSKERKEFLDFSITMNIKQAEEFTVPNNLINLRNGVLDINTMELLPHSPQYYFTRQVEYDWGDNDQAPVFRGFIKLLANGDSKREETLIQWIGYVCSGSLYHIQKVFVGIGSGNNGKSVYCRLIQHLVGMKYYTTHSVKNLSSANGLANIEDKLVNVCGEESKKSFSDNSVLKQLSGDDLLTGANKYENFVTFRNRAKIMVIMNDIPFINDLSEGMKRRLLVVPFNWDWRRDGNKIDNIEDKLVAELPAILHICLKAYKELSARGDFVVSKADEALIEEILLSENEVWEFLHDNYTITKSELHRVHTQAIYDDFCRDYGNSMSFKSFGRELLHILKQRYNFSANIRYREGNRQMRGVAGILKKVFSAEKEVNQDTSVISFPDKF